MTKPNPENYKNCLSKCAYDCAQLSYTIQHRTVLIISPLTSRQTPQLRCCLSEERGLFCIERDVKPQLDQTIREESSAYRVLELFPKSEDLGLEAVDGLGVLDDELVFGLRRCSQVGQLPLELLDLGDRVTLASLSDVQLGFQLVNLHDQAAIQPRAPAASCLHDGQSDLDLDNEY